MRIGALISRSGPAGLWGPSTEACAILAAGELNVGGGVAGRDVELFVADPGWTETEAAAVAADLVDIAEVDAIVGMHPSNVRQVIKQQIGGRVPYYYTPQYEGGEVAPSTVAIGGTDSWLMKQTLPWFTERRRARRFCLIANDYVWPQMAMETASALISEAGGWVAGRIVAPFEGDYAEALDTVRQIKPDVVIMLLLGAEAVRFNRAFAAVGLQRDTLRFGLGIDENVLLGIGPDGTEGLYAATTFTLAEHSLQAERLSDLYRGSFGEFAPSLSVFGQSCYEGIHLAVEMARRCGSPRGRDVAHYVAGLRRDSIRSMLPRSKFEERLRMNFVVADGIDWRIISPQ
ncbi:MAG: substrate-binding domain-containing protein [Ancalomicrobiaceae bacterium]|nr:substrate-binding domain-containing protein [Ancalomicrobiaceae bacterium]